MLNYRASIINLHLDCNNNGAIISALLLWLILAALDVFSPSQNRVLTSSFWTSIDLAQYWYNF